MKTEAELRAEAEEILENMTAEEWKLWKWEYADAGNDISENAHTVEQKEEMFIQEYIEVNG